MSKASKLLEDMMPLEEMSSYPEESTGIHNTIFISPKGRAKHAARIKVAIDPPTSFSPRTKSISVQIDDYSVRGSVSYSSDLLSKVKQFIDLNKQVIMDYWEYKITTPELTSRLKSI